MFSISNVHEFVKIRILRYNSNGKILHTRQEEKNKVSRLKETKYLYMTHDHAVKIIITNNTAAALQGIIEMSKNLNWSMN